MPEKFKDRAKDYFLYKHAVISPDSRYALTQVNDSTAHIWSLEREFLGKLNASHVEQWKPVFSPNGQQILTMSGNRTFTLWNLKGEAMAIYTQTGHIIQQLNSPKMVR